MNSFTHKSRFAILSEDLNQKEEKVILNGNSNSNSSNRNITPNINNTFKRINESRMSNSEYIRIKDNESQVKKEYERIKLEKEKKQSLSKENFPELSLTSKKFTHNDCKKSISFANKLNVAVKSNIVVKDFEPGWVQIMYDPKSQKIVMNFAENEFSMFSRDENMIEPLTDDECNHNVMMALADLHKKRTEEYIELWGKEDWEKHFLFANDEYNYLDEENEFNDSELYFEDDDDFIYDL